MTPAPSPMETAPNTFQTAVIPRSFCTVNSHQIAPKEPMRPSTLAVQMPRRSDHSRLPMLAFSPVRTTKLPMMDAMMPTPAIRNGRMNPGAPPSVSAPTTAAVPASARVAMMEPT